MQDKTAWNKSLDDSGVFINGNKVDSSTVRFPFTIEEQNFLFQSEPLQNGELRLSALALQHELEECDVEITGSLADFVFQDITAYPVDATRIYIELAQPSIRTAKRTNSKRKKLVVSYLGVGCYGFCNTSR